MENLMQKDSICEIENANDSSLMNLIINYDGSVTKLLENLFGEPMEVECLAQGYNKIDEKDWSDVDKNEKVLLRTVFLKGKESGIRYLYATSIIRTDYLDKEIAQILLEGKKGIGELIYAYKLETYKELIGNKPVYNSIMRSIFSTEDEITSRVYKLYMKGMPVMLITEYYPHALYRDLI